ncbi:IBR domain protein [Penicillium malachiteum]|uniref:IBR domain protein n=1 Tax=Penicillium malachiteum TaxID=1324776 RepID=A0AAD6MZM0_9EURO|nr:IBR domain protein [Penicillium malachiteum]
MTSHAMKDKSLFPVQCCGQEFPPKQVTSTLGIRERKLYLQRREEHGVPPSERWYCPKTSCARFIHPRNLSISEQSKQLKCPFCRAQICVNCRDLAHEARQCTVDENLNDLLLFARRKHWQRCFRCHALVEKVGGCTHMSYVCGDPYPCTCRGTEVAYDGIQLEEYGDLDVNTVVAAMEHAERDDD